MWHMPDKSIIYRAGHVFREEVSKDVILRENLNTS
jgi:hypothetical protein